MNVRNHERDMYIYNARKVDKRTHVDIGRELGISPERVRQVYRRMDWAINKYNADHHLKNPEMRKYMMEHMPDDTDSD